jgi:hypothetical protein
LDKLRRSLLDFETRRYKEREQIQRKDEKKREKLSRKAKHIQKQEVEEDKGKETTIRGRESTTKEDGGREVISTKEKKRVFGRNFGSRNDTFQGLETHLISHLCAYLLPNNFCCFLFLVFSFADNCFHPVLTLVDCLHVL